LEDDGVAECFEASDVASLLGCGRNASVVVVSAEVFVSGLGVGEEVPDDDEDGAADCDDGLLLAPSAGEASVTGAEEGVGAAGADGGFAEDAGQVAVAVSGGAVALVLPRAGLDPG
jgi:hypothetical protein